MRQGQNEVIYFNTGLHRGQFTVSVYALEYKDFISYLYTLHSTLYTLHSTLYTLHSTLYTVHCAHLHSTLYTLTI